MQGKEILRLVDSLHRNKDIDVEVIFQAIESALQSAAKKHFGTDEDITIQIDRETGDVAAIKGEERIEPEMLGRIAAQTAKQIIIQKIREAESQTIYEEYIEQVGDLITGSVQRFEGGSIIVNLMRTEAILPRSEQIPGEHYQAGERVRAIILDVRQQNSLVKIFLSRTSPDFIRRLFELEVPEVAEGVVQIRKIAREPGLRTKVAVESLDARVDAIGACVGVRGTRIKSIIDEVKGEKIDIIPWSEAPETLIADSLRPADILQITLEEGETTKRAIVTVPEDQLSLAIGWKGQNVRLAVKMTGWDIDIVPPEVEEEEEEQAEELEQGPDAETETPEPVAEPPATDVEEEQEQEELEEEPVAETDLPDAVDEQPATGVQEEEQSLKTQESERGVAAAEEEVEQPEADLTTEG
jgi:N utilization substance protein A